MFFFLIGKISPPTRTEVLIFILFFFFTKFGPLGQLREPEAETKSPLTPPPPLGGPGFNKKKSSKPFFENIFFPR